MFINTNNDSGKGVATYLKKPFLCINTSCNSILVLGFMHCLPKFTIKGQSEADDTTR